MKKMLGLILILALAACALPVPAEESLPMTKEQFDQADYEGFVCVEAYVQASHTWWEGTITLYLQNEEGGYFAYNVSVEEDAASQLVPGTKVRISGYKIMWPEVNGEIEIVDATLEILEAEPWIAEPLDVTELLGTEDLADHMNEKISIKGAEVVASYPTNGTGETDESTGYPFLYSKDGGHEANSDLSFTVRVNDAECELFVESDLCGNETDVYRAVEALQIGDIIDCEGFLYWWLGANPHITGLTKAE